MTCCAQWRQWLCSTSTCSRELETLGGAFNDAALLQFSEEFPTPQIFLEKCQAAWSDWQRLPHATDLSPCAATRAFWHGYISGISRLVTESFWKETTTGVPYLRLYALTLGALKIFEVSASFLSACEDSEYSNQYDKGFLMSPPVSWLLRSSTYVAVRSRHGRPDITVDAPEGLRRFWNEDVCPTLSRTGQDRLTGRGTATCRLWPLVRTALSVSLGRSAEQMAKAWPGVESVCNETGFGTEGLRDLALVGEMAPLTAKRKEKGSAKLTQLEAPWILADVDVLNFVDLEVFAALRQVNRAIGGQLLYYDLAERTHDSENAWPRALLHWAVSSYRTPQEALEAFKALDDKDVSPRNMPGPKLISLRLYCRQPLEKLRMAQWLLDFEQDLSEHSDSLEWPMPIPKGQAAQEDCHRELFKAHMRRCGDIIEGLFGRKASPLSLRHSYATLKEARAARHLRVRDCLDDGPRPSGPSLSEAAPLKTSRREEVLLQKGSCSLSMHALRVTRAKESSQEKLVRSWRHSIQRECQSGIRPLHALDAAQDTGSFAPFGKSHGLSYSLEHSPDMPNTLRAQEVASRNTFMTPQQIMVARTGDCKNNLQRNFNSCTQTIAGHLKNKDMLSPVCRHCTSLHGRPCSAAYCPCLVPSQAVVQQHLMNAWDVPPTLSLTAAALWNGTPSKDREKAIVRKNKPQERDILMTLEPQEQSCVSVALFLDIDSSRLMGPKVTEKHFRFGHWWTPQPGPLRAIYGQRGRSSRSTWHLFDSLMNTFVAPRDLHRYLHVSSDAEPSKKTEASKKPTTPVSGETFTLKNLSRQRLEILSLRQGQESQSMRLVQNQAREATLLYWSYEPDAAKEEVIQCENGSRADKDMWRFAEIQSPTTPFEEYCLFWRVGLQDLWRPSGSTTAIKFYTLLCSKFAEVPATPRAPSTSRGSYDLVPLSALGQQAMFRSTRLDVMRVHEVASIRNEDPPAIETKVCTFPLTGCYQPSQHAGDRREFSALRLRGILTKTRDCAQCKARTSHLRVDSSTERLNWMCLACLHMLTDEQKLRQTEEGMTKYMRRYRADEMSIVELNDAGVEMAWILKVLGELYSAENDVEVAVGANGQLLLQGSPEARKFLIAKLQERNGSSASIRRESQEVALMSYPRHTGAERYRQQGARHIYHDLKSTLALGGVAEASVCIATADMTQMVHALQCFEGKVQGCGRDQENLFATGDVSLLAAKRIHLPASQHQADKVGLRALPAAQVNATRENMRAAQRSQAAQYASSSIAQPRRLIRELSASLKEKESKRPRLSL